MTLWRKTRTEMAGAYRSVRYDLGRRDQPPSPEPVDGEHTSTGMSTFGGEIDPGESRGLTRPPRRAVAVAAFGTLAVAGAAGSYFAVVNGLGALLTDEPAQPEPYPLAIADTSGAASNAGMGRGGAAEPGKAARPDAAVPAAGTAAGVPAAPRTTTQPAPPRPAVPPTTPALPGSTPSEDCDCLSPPVPTPTSVPSSAAPTSEPASPKPTDSASAEPEPTDSASSEPEPSGSSPAARRHHRHR